MPKKTLIVSYLPRYARSHTKRLLDAFREEIRGPEIPEIDEIDLTCDVPDLFMPLSVDAYLQRNYLGRELDQAKSASLARMDRMTAQLKEADTVVLATPMYNFSLPAAVKAWFDSVMLKGETWDVVNGNYKGLMRGKRAVILLSSGGVYEGGMASWEHAASLARIEFEFMGFSDVRVVHAGGMNSGEDVREESLKKSCAAARAVAREWYSGG